MLRTLTGGQQRPSTSYGDNLEGLEGLEDVPYKSTIYTDLPLPLNDYLVYLSII